MQSIPAHVPPSLVVDLDIYNLVRDGEESQLAWRRFVGHGPLVWSPYNGGHWVVTQADDLRTLYRDTDNLSARDGAGIPAHGSVRLIPNETDPPEHAEYRRAIIPHFSPKAIDAIASGIRKRAIDLIEEIRPRGGCEFVADFASKLPIMVFLNIMGLPLDDRTRLLEITANFARNSDSAAKNAAMSGLVAYLDEHITERRAKPADDLISAIIATRIGDQPIDQGEMLSICLMLLLGGLDTVTALLGFVAAYLADHPEQCAEIRARGNQLSSVTEELLRRFAIASIARSAARDFELHGVTLKAGDRVLMPTILYNLDEEKFADPTAVNFDRGRINHLTFGSGTHACIGSYLARTELGIFLEEWLSRIPDFEIPPDKRPKSHSGGIDSLEVLMLRWKS